MHGLQFWPDDDAAVAAVAAVAAIAADAANAANAADNAAAAACGQRNKQTSWINFLEEDFLSYCGQCYKLATRRWQLWLIINSKSSKIWLNKWTR